jgi:transposase
MTKRELFWLSDNAWALLEPHLPHGKPRVDDRRVISGILHVLKVGCRWRDVQPEYGPAKTVYNRYHRWPQPLALPAHLGNNNAEALIKTG